MTEQSSKERGVSALSLRARELIEAYGKATPTKWRIHPEKRFGDWIVGADERAGFVARCSILNSGNQQWEPHPLAAVANADFIVAARNDSPAIAEAYLEAEKLLRELGGTTYGEGDKPRHALTDLATRARAFLAKHGEGG